MPNPQALEGDYDDTDFLDPQNGGVLRPVILVRAEKVRGNDGTEDNVMYSNAGVKVCKNDEVRFTCAFHGWEACVGDKNV